MWTSIYVANTKKQADKMRQALEAEGILTNVRPIGADTAKSLFEIQVLASEVEEAQAVLCGGS
jgi:hypothetical protein